jgi:hypothetical protein
MCIPHRATVVASFASYFRDHSDVEIIYELSNEIWNPTFFLSFRRFTSNATRSGQTIPQGAINITAIVPQPVWALSAESMGRSRAGAGRRPPDGKSRGYPVDL